MWWRVEGEGKKKALDGFIVYRSSGHAAARRAVEKVRASTAAWLAYADEQEEADPVIPLLVVQVGDKPTQETLVRTLDRLEEEGLVVRREAGEDGASERSRGARPASD